MTSLLPQHVALLCFLAISLALAGMGLLIRDLRKTFSRRQLVRIRTDGRVVHQAALEQKLRARESAGSSALQRFDRWFQWLLLESTGSLSELGGVLLLVLSALVIGGLAWILQGDLAGACLFGGLGMLLPLPLLMRSQRLRRLRIQEQLPEALDLLARAVRAGESIDQALALCGQRGPEPLAKEFRRCARQIEMGLSVSNAMRSLGRRVRVADVRIFTTAIAVHREAGGNLARTLDRMASVVRERMTYRRQLRAVTAAGRFSATMVSLAGPLLFAYMFAFQYDYVSRLFVEPLGQSLLAVAVLLELIGLVWVIRMQKSE